MDAFISGHKWDYKPIYGAEGSCGFPNPQAVGLEFKSMAS